MMELINKKHKDIIPQLKSKTSPYVMLKDTASVYFSGNAGTEFGLMEGLYMHFVEDEGLMFFFCNAEEDGFKINSRSGKRYAVINDSSLVRLIQKRKKISIGTKFLLEHTNIKHNSHHLIKINFNRIVQTSS